MATFEEFGQTFSGESHVRGKEFERVCKWILEHDPTYAPRMRTVWLWDDWPDRWGPDFGINLVAQDTDGKTWAIQAKCYDEDYYVTKGDVDAFLAESTHETIDYRLLIATTDRLGPHASGVIKRQHQVRPVHTLLLEGLQNLSIDWPASIDRLDHAAVPVKNRQSGILSRVC